MKRKSQIDPAAGSTSSRKSGQAEKGENEQKMKAGQKQSTGAAMKLIKKDCCGAVFRQSSDAPQFILAIKEPCPQSNQQVQQNNNNFPQKELKNKVFLRNIPQELNKFKTLMDYFVPFGSIKQVKLDVESNSANVTFQKQEEALKFVQSKPVILNRQCIAYSCEENVSKILAPISQQKDIIKDAQTLIANKYQCLLYLIKQPLSEAQTAEIKQEMEKCKELKKLKAYNSETVKVICKLKSEYDWTVTFRQSASTMSKKIVANKFRKYGPIGTIEIASEKCKSSNADKTGEGDQTIFTISLQFLGVKSCWAMYRECCKSMKLEVCGKRLLKIFEEWLQAQETKQAKDQQQDSEKAKIQEKVEVQKQAKDAELKEKQKQQKPDEKFLAS